MMDMRDIDLYNAIVRERQAEILDEIKTHTLLTGGQTTATRRKALLVLIGVALLVAVAVIATVFPSLGAPSYPGVALLVAVAAIATGAQFVA